MKCFYFLLHLISVQSVWRKIWIWKYLFKTGGKRLRKNAWSELLGMIFSRCTRSKEIDLVLSLNKKMFIYVWCIWHLIRKVIPYIYILQKVYIAGYVWKKVIWTMNIRVILRILQLCWWQFRFTIDSMY